MKYERVYYHSQCACARPVPYQEPGMRPLRCAVCGGWLRLPESREPEPESERPTRRLMLAIAMVCAALAIAHFLIR